ncbi:MAG: type II toxin-antitoxin system PemK/MazF family toxin [Roseburia sp.]
MGKNITDDDIIKHKKNAIKQLNNTFETFINSPNPKHKKKADLVAYWIESYSKYLLSEEKFDYTSIPRYKRGDIISVNFGFNVGSEHGGLHYALVLDNDNRQSSPVITVIPLSSGNENSTYERDVFLGNELHDKLNTKYNKLITQVEGELLEVTKTIDILTKSINNKSNTEENLQRDISELLANLSNRVDNLNREKKILQIYEKDISKLKEGSIALMEQITTVSKMRIYKPKNSSDLLYGVKFSDGAMDKINEKLKELYVYSK